MITALEDNQWFGRPAFIVGGGASLREFDWSRLDGQLWIGCNCAGFYDPTITLACDVQWMERYAEDLRIQRCGGIKLWQRVQDDYDPPASWWVVNAVDGWSWSIMDGLLRGPNVGVTALHLAALLGARPIYLLGFDMHDNGETPIEHWHDEYVGRDWASPSRVMRLFRASFENVAGLVPHRVVNLNPDSSLTCFPRLSWAEAFPRGAPTPQMV